MFTYLRKMKNVHKVNVKHWLVISFPCWSYRTVVIKPQKISVHHPRCSCVLFVLVCVGWCWRTFDMMKHLNNLFTYLMSFKSMWLAAMISYYLLSFRLKINIYPLIRHDDDNFIYNEWRFIELRRIFSIMSSLEFWGLVIYLLDVIITNTHARLYHLLYILLFKYYLLNSLSMNVVLRIILFHSYDGEETTDIWRLDLYWLLSLKANIFFGLKGAKKNNWHNFLLLSHTLRISANI